MQVLQQNIQKLAADKNQDILIYSATGNRSTVAWRMVIESGLKKIYNLRYGISDGAKRDKFDQVAGLPAAGTIPLR